MHMKIFNRFSPAADGWIHLVARGEHPWTSPDGTVRLLQVIDGPALASMLRHFENQDQSGRLLIDYDHESHDSTKRTAAAGWIEKLEVREDGLWGLPRWSAQGLRDVEGGAYRFISPVFELAHCEELPPASPGTPRLRPKILADAALTNRPNMKTLHPITNRSASETPDQPTTNNTEIMDYKKELLRLLNLPDTATDEAIAAAIEAVMAERADEESKAQKLEDELINRDLDHHNIRGGNREVWRQILKSNRQNGLSALEGAGHTLTNRPTLATVTPLHKPGTTQAPGLITHSASRNPRQLELVRNIQNTRNCSFQQAWDSARAERPDLFGRTPLQ